MNPESLLLQFSDDLLWEIFQHIHHNIGANICTQIRGCYRKKYVITRLLTDEQLTEAIKYYRVNDQNFIQCCRLGLTSYIRANYKFGYDTPVILKYRGPGAEFSVPRNIHAIIHASTGNTPEHTQIVRMLIDYYRSVHTKNELIAQLSDGVISDQIMEAILCATEASNVDVVRTLMDLLMSPGCRKYTSPVGSRALYVACSYNKVDIVEILLQIIQLNNTGSGVVVNDVNNLINAACVYDGVTSLCLLLNAVKSDPTIKYVLEMATITACTRGNRPALDLLMAHPDWSPKSNFMPDYINIAFGGACGGGHRDLVMFLLNDPRFSALNPFFGNNSAFINACASSSRKIIEIIITLPGFTSGFWIDHGFAWLCGNGEIELVELFLTDSAFVDLDPTSDDNLALILACTNGYTKIVLRLLELPGNKPVKNIDQALVVACRENRMEIIKILLQQPEANPGNTNNEPIVAACSGGHRDLVEFLLTIPGVNVIDQMDNIFIDVCGSGYVDLLKYLFTIPGFAPTNIKDTFIGACNGGHIEIVKILLGDRIDSVTPERDRIDSVTPERDRIDSVTPERDRIDSVTPERDRIDSVTPERDRIDSVTLNTGFFHACECGHTEIIKLLLSLGVDPVIEDNRGLILAVKGDCRVVVEMLLRFPVNPDAQNYRAHILAYKNKRWDILNMLMVSRRNTLI